MELLSFFLQLGVLSKRSRLSCSLNELGSSVDAETGHKRRECGMQLWQGSWMICYLICRWQYDHQPAEGSREAELLDACKNPRTWV